MAYPSLEAALEDVRDLARAMTLKCALNQLSAGGGKIVVLDHPGLDRDKAFAALGTHIEILGGILRTAGDYGTTPQDLRAMARTTRYVIADEARLTRAAGYGVRRCLEAAQRHRGRPARLDGVRIAVQGCGAIGAAVARILADDGAVLFVSDLDPRRAESVESVTGATVLDPSELVDAEVDVLVPCAHGRWLDLEAADRLRASVVCGPANRVLTGPDVARRLADRGIVHVPDLLASAGAVIEGVGRTVMGLPDRTGLIDRLGDTTAAVLAEAAEQRTTPSEVAEALALRRLAAAEAS